MLFYFFCVPLAPADAHSHLTACPRNNAMGHSALGRASQLNPSSTHMYCVFSPSLPNCCLGCVLHLPVLGLALTSIWDRYLLATSRRSFKRLDHTSPSDTKTTPPPSRLTPPILIRITPPCRCTEVWLQRSPLPLKQFGCYTTGTRQSSHCWMSPGRILPFN